MFKEKTYRVICFFKLSNGKRGLTDSTFTGRKLASKAVDKVLKRIKEGVEHETGFDAEISLLNVIKI